jgi:hypothetical protein
LIEACEACKAINISVERPTREKSSQGHRSVKRSAAKNSTEASKKQKSESKHYCSEHGLCTTQSSCNSNQNLHNEINLSAKTSSTKKILEIHAFVIKRVQGKLEARETQENYCKCK